MYLPDVLDGILLSDTAPMVRHPLRSRGLQSTLLPTLLSMNEKSSAFESRWISESVLSIGDGVDGSTRRLKRDTYDIQSAAEQAWVNS